MRNFGLAEFGIFLIDLCEEINGYNPFHNKLAIFHIMTASGEYKGLENEFSQTMQKGEENMKMGKSSLETRPKIWGLLGAWRDASSNIIFEFCWWV